MGAKIDEAMYRMEAELAAERKKRQEAAVKTFSQMYGASSEVFQRQVIQAWRGIVDDVNKGHAAAEREASEQRLQESLRRLEKEVQQEKEQRLASSKKMMFSLVNADAGTILKTYFEAWREVIDAQRKERVENHWADEMIKMQDQIKHLDGKFRRSMEGWRRRIDCSVFARYIKRYLRVLVMPLSHTCILVVGPV